MRATLRRSLDDERGISLVELSFASALSMLVLGLVTAIVFLGFKTGTFTSAQSFSLDGARVALQKLSRDFQGALGISRCDPSTPLDNCAIVVSQTPSGAQTTVKYERVDTNLRRSIQDPVTLVFGTPEVVSDRVANPVSSPIFSCLTASTLLRVQIDLVIQPMPNNSPTFTLRTTARPRNYLVGSNSCP